MRLKTWLVAALGLGSLVVLITVSMMAAARKAQEIYAQLDALNTHHRIVETKLRALRADVHLSSIYVRDYLLDRARERAPEYRQRIAQFRRTNMATVAELRPLVGRGDQVAILQSTLDQYWAAFDPLFDWTPAAENRPQRVLPAPRSGAAPRGGPEHRPPDRGAEQRERRCATRRGGPASCRAAP